MKELENDSDQRPPKMPGINQESCRHVKISGTNRAHVKPACNGENQLKADSAICSTALVMVVQGYSMHKKRKFIFGKQADSRNFMCHNTDPPGAYERVDTTEFRRQSHCLRICHEKTSEIALNARIYSFTSRDRPERIYLSKCIPLPCMAVNWHSPIIASRQTSILISGKKPFRWRKNSQLKWLEKSSFRQEQCAETGTEIYNGFRNN